MKRNILCSMIIMTVTLLLTGCQNSPGTNPETVTEQNTTRLKTDSLTAVKPPLPRHLVLYIHGYNNRGAGKHQVYGDIKNEPLGDAIAMFTGFTQLNSFDTQEFTHGVLLTTYYGDTPPAYYTPQDIEDIEAVTQAYGGGVPRYALIVAKFIRHALQSTQADDVTIISGSMGSLVTRWLIEKDLAHLASERKITAWLSINGVVRGNYLSSQSDLVKIVNEVEKQPVDVKKMSYHWIETNLHNPKSVADSPLYSHIRMGFVSSTQSGKPFGTLMKTMPNDGYQRVRDTSFKEVAKEVQFKNLPPTHTLFHQGHIGIKDYPGAWAQIATFLTSTKRIRITLEDVSIGNLHEERMPLQHKTRAEVVFASEVRSPAVQSRWNIDAAISQRTLTGGTLPVHYYYKTGTPQHFTQVLFDDFVLPEAKTLQLHLRGYELDDAVKYGIHEPLLGGNERVGEADITLPLKDGTYEVRAEEYHGSIRMECFDYTDR